MANNTGHGHGAVPPGTAKVKVELIVLDILIAADRMLFKLATVQRDMRDTHCLERTTGHVRGHGTGNGRLLCHAENLTGHDEPALS